MSELGKLLVGTAAAMVVIYLIGLAALWRITKEAVQWLLLILVLIWAL
jgi:hypothetical protein